MPTITLSVPEDLKREMDKAAEINWSEVAREAIREKLAQLVLFKSITSRSTLTVKDAERIGKEISESLERRYKIPKR
jgi:metal-responsive CopG/Arc/MetJ family transcriptional regulator